MAEITPDSSLAEVISSLDLAAVPEKLHCSTCHGFLLNAYKTSCCEQNVCEKCFNEIADHCPMCKHKPFSKELCRPAKAMRNTVKAYLRNVEKTLADERVKGQIDQTATNGTEKSNKLDVVDAQAMAQAEVNREVENGTLEEALPQSEEPTQELSTPILEVQQSIEVGGSALEHGESVTAQQNLESTTNRQPSIESDANDDEVEIQVEPSAEDEMLEMPQGFEMDEQEQQFDHSMNEVSKNNDPNMHEMGSGMDQNSFNTQNMNMNMMGFNGMGMDFGMMQQMMNMNPMMSMGMGPMFGGFGGSNGNMSGMNMMGMNFNPNQMFNGWNGQNSNMWQNNNTMNAMGGDFGSQFGSNMSQQGNFYSQQFHNGDFNSYNGRYGRGRGRGGRGAYGRGRGSFNQYQQNSGYHNAHEQQQYEIQSMQAQMAQNVNVQDGDSKGRANPKEEEPHDQDDFAPGGQDEVQEALGDDDRESKSKTTDSSPKATGPDPVETENTPQEAQEAQEPTKEREPTNEPAPEKIIPEAYHEDFDTMAPPSAPTGPSGRYSDKEFAFRARGHGKYSARARGSFSASSGYPPSPIRSVSQSSITAPSPPAKGLGVVGAPTGPRAMREPPATKPTARSAGSNGGFQIMGRASMQSQASQSKDHDQPRSESPANGYDEYDDEKFSSRRHSKYEKYGDTKKEGESEYNRDDDRSDRDRDRKTKYSKRTDYKDDYEMQDADHGYESPDRKSSRRGSRYDRDRSRKDDKQSTASKYRSSRRRHEDEAQSDYEQDDHDEEVSDRHRTARNGKSSSKYDDTRDRDRDSYRDRKRDRDRDREREREDDRSKEKEDRHRKRSRHDRDREDEYDDPDEDESRHRSRRHKKDHHSSGRRDRDKDVEDSDLGLRISGRSNSNRQSALPTPTSATSSVPPVSLGDAEKDPHTLEREARNRERMVKEQQRREKAALDKRGSTAGAKASRTTTASGRRVSYKYEDEVERGMGAADEREKARWR